MSEMTQATGNIDHAARAHAALSASSAHRWLMCPPSVKLSEQFADKPSVYAEEGTFLHELSEMKLHRYLGDMTPEVLEAQYAEHRDNDFYSDEAENVTDEYVDFCIETIEAVRASCPDPLILVEHRLDFSEYVPDGFGTGDLVIVADGVLEIVDFKGGRGVRVEADHNSQLMLYGLGALLEFEALYDIQTVRMSIVQPRLNNISTFEMPAGELLQWAKTEVRPKALLAARGEGEFCAGEWCRFCKARYTCRKRSEYHMRLAERDFKQPDLLTDEEIDVYKRQDFNIYHECVHYYEHYLFFRLPEMHHNDLRRMKTEEIEITGDEEKVTNSVYWMEKQANRCEMCIRDRCIHYMRRQP